VASDCRRWVQGIAVIAGVAMAVVLLFAYPTHDMTVPARVATARAPAGPPEPVVPASATQPLATVLAVEAPSASIRPIPPASVRATGRALPHRPLVYRFRPSRDPAQSP
jgi:hypothetical protein